MTFANQAKRLSLFDFKAPQMRAFYISAFAFFMCFFAWFGIVPFMPQVTKDLGLTPEQKWNSIIASVAGTVIARLLLGKLCDRFGPRLCYSILLVLGSLPVIGIAFVQNYAQFVTLRFLIGFIGASFVITQYHTSIMFGPNCVGTANATSAGWGNLGGGANRLGMLFIIAPLVAAFGVSESMQWRFSMGIAGIICMLMGAVYFFFTQDAPEGNFADLKAAGKLPPPRKDEAGFLVACRDYRVWILFLVYAGCFGIELTVYNTMDDYLQKTFDLSRKSAGTMVACFALMNIFARTLGGFFGDRFGAKQGLKGRVKFLTMIMLAEGVVLALFSQISVFWLALAVLIAFSLSVQMAEGATFTVVPFVNKKCIGSVAGIVGAGGNVGAVMAAIFLKQMPSMSTGYLVIGGVVAVAGLLSIMIRFSESEEAALAADTASA